MNVQRCILFVKYDTALYYNFKADIQFDVPHDPVILYDGLNVENLYIF
jgi:hypothetical protein